MSIDQTDELQVFSCPLCGMDAPHTVSGERNGVYAIICTNCRNGSLVSNEVLRMYQAQWEEELRDILHHLDPPNE